MAFHAQKPDNRPCFTPSSMTTYNVPDMSCGHCRATIDKVVHSLDPAARIEFDMAARRISLESVTEPARIEAALADAGYPVTPA